MAPNVVALDRLKAQLLTSGLAERNNALFQVINQLIDNLRQGIDTLSQQINVISGGGGGGGGGSTGSTTAIGLMPEIPTEGERGLDGLPGKDGVSIQGPPGMDGQNAEEEIFLIPPVINDYPGPYAELTDTTNQQPGVTTPIQVTFNTEGLIYGFTHSSGDLTALEAGNYLVAFTGQIGETANGQVNIDVWLRVNSTDLTNSNNRNYVRTTQDATVIIVDALVRLEKNDILKVFFSVDDATKGAGLLSLSPGGEPVIPSAMLLAHKISR